MFEIRGSRNRIILFAVLGIVLVLPVLYLLLVKQAPPLLSEDDVENVDNVVEIIVGDQPVPIPEDFKKTLQELGITGLALIDNTGKLRATAIDGTDRDLCGPRQKEGKAARTCELDTSVRALVYAVGRSIEALNAVGLGRCPPFPGTNKRKDCHKDGDNKNRFKWHSLDNESGKTHKECYQTCE
jgi:hypothetical protein